MVLFACRGGSVTIEVFVSCTKRKQCVPTPDLHFHSIEPSTVAGAAQQWHDRALESKDRRPMDRLYCGGGWSTARALYSTAQSLGASKLHVLSAGFGLISEHHLIPSYSATFAPEEDQIAKRIAEPGTAAEKHKSWWQNINSLRGLGETPITTTTNPASHCIVTAGIQYILACSTDLSCLAREQRLGSLIIVCTGASPSIIDSALRACLLPIDVRIEQLLGGPRSTLNQRATIWLLSNVVPHTGFDTGHMTSYINKTLGAAPNTRHPAREQVCDAQITSWLRAELARDPSLSASKLLSLFRRRNTACEQSRFARLVSTARHDTTEEHPI